MKTVASLRVSTAQQDVRSQRLAILEYARHHDVRIDAFIEATASGQASDKRRRLDELMHILQRGDRLVVSELSRLGRSLGQIVAILDALAKADVAFVALKEHIRVEGTRDIQTKVMTTLFALFAEVERDLIAERTREGLARARASGKKLGRPKGALGVSRLDGKEDDIRRFLELGVSKTAIAKITGVSRTSLYSFMRTRGLKPSPSRVFLHESCRYPDFGESRPTIPRPCWRWSSGPGGARAGCGGAPARIAGPRRVGSSRPVLQDDEDDEDDQHDDVKHGGCSLSFRSFRSFRRARRRAIRDSATSLQPRRRLDNRRAWTALEPSAKR